MTADRDDDLGVLDLDDMPGIPPLVRNARVAADLLFVDPPPAYYVKADDRYVHISAAYTDEMAAWLDRHGEFHEFGPGLSEERRAWFGIVEGVTFTVSCEVTA